MMKPMPKKMSKARAVINTLYASIRGIPFCIVNGGKGGAIGGIRGGQSVVPCPARLERGQRGQEGALGRVR